MNEYALLVFAGVGLAVCLTNWRLGFLLCLVVGCLQDPARKLIPGEPVSVTVLVFVFAAVTFVAASAKEPQFNMRRMLNWHPALRTPLTLFVVVVVIQSIMTVIRYDSLIIAAIGLLAYLAPLPAILLGYTFCRSEKDVQRFIKVYLALNILMISGVYLSSWGFDWPALKSVGEGLVAYSPVTGEPIVLRSGFYRAPEMAAWHAAMSICLLVILCLVVKGHLVLKYLSGVLILFFWGGLLYTGRRKFIMEIFIFVCLYGGLLLLLRESVSKTARTFILLMVALGVAAVGYLLVVPDEVKAGIDPYYDRGATVQVDATNRASLMTIESFQWVIDQNGFFGAGAGTGSQGAQHFGGGANLVGVAAEGGLGKVLAELGVQGVVLLAWLLVSLGTYFWAIVKYLKKVDVGLASLAYGLMAVLAANAAVFTTAHQVFGDPLVLVLLGFLTGFVMAAPKFASRSPQKREPNCRRVTPWLGERV